MSFEERKNLINIWWTFVNGMSVGSLWTSLGFFWFYDQWRPLVAAACVVAAIETLAKVMKAYP